MPESSALVKGTRSTAPGTWLLVLPPDRGGPELSAAPGARDVSWAEFRGATALLSGRFYGLDSAPDEPPVQALLAAVRGEGSAALRRLGGFFSVAVWDAAEQSLLCARDPLGIHPLFWTRTSAGLMLSPSVDTLLRQPEVGTRLNRAAVADHLRHLWPRPEETYFDGISRVLPGHWLQVTGARTTTERYWDPLFPGQHPAWIGEGDLGRFDQLLDDSVGRLTEGRRAGIYLSGGLDSVSVGALATDHAQQRREQPPHAFSLAFPDPFSEEDLQRSVASQLGMPQQVARLDDALAGDGIVRAAFERGAVGAPLQNPWLPAYRWLAGQAREQGCETILTGSGGDEWLTVTPVYAADLLRSGRFLELARLGRTQARSFNVAPALLARNLLWRFGMRQLLVHRGGAAMQRVLPGRYASTRVQRLQSKLDARPWLAPDPGLRRELLARDEEYANRPGDDGLLPLSGPREYFRECRQALTHPLVSMEAEEVFEYSRGAGVEVVHPYWDTRLVEFLHATPPELLNQGGRSKGLIRSMLARRFPDLGFERQRKAITASYFGSAVLAEAPQVWRDMGGARLLAEAGIVDLDASAALYQPRPAGAAADHTVTDPMWELVTVEGWLRRHE